jgi:nucleoside-diphosphate-sugar epimerase
VTITRVLVTGSAGRLGSALLDLLHGQGIAATVLDRVPTEHAGADRVLVGAADDHDLVRSALDGVDAVAHLAAIPAPNLGTAEEVFGRNSLATFVVLDAAGRAGIPRAVFASSQSIYGLAFSPTPLEPFYVPIDAEHPLQVADPYALSKQADEATGEMIARRYGMTVVALRYPFLGGLGDRLPTMAAVYREDPSHGARTLWAYLEDRDAATAAFRSLTAPLSGYHMFQVAAPETLAADDTRDLLERYYPQVEQRSRLEGRAVPFDIAPAAEKLDFHAEFHYEPEPQ